MIEKLDRLRVQRKVIRVFVVEKVYCVHIQFQTQRLQEQNVIAHHVLIGKIEFMHNDRIHMIIAQQIIQRRFISYIFEENIQCL